MRRGILTLTLQTTERLKMRVRLNGWQRIGIILSVVWAVTGYLWEETSIMRRNLDMATLDEKLCLEYPQAYAADVDCVDKFRKSYDFLVKGTAPITNAAIVGLVPIPFAWLTVYALIGLWRWIRRGFNT
jgi:hypothetical protein